MNDITPHIVSFRMTDDELRERLGVQDDEVLNGKPILYSRIDDIDGTLIWIIEADKMKGSYE